MRKINQYKRTYYKEYGALVTFIFITFLSLTPIEDQVYVREVKPVEATVVEVKEETMEQKIVKHFPRSHKTMIAIAYAESGMKMEAKGFNCYYNDDMTIVYETRVKGSHSAACKPSHRKYAWSVDCFALQRNYKGQECPKGVTVDAHLEEVAELSKVQGLQAWSSFNNGRYLAYTK